MSDKKYYERILARIEEAADCDVVFDHMSGHCSIGDLNIGTYLVVFKGINIHLKDGQVEKLLKKAQHKFYRHNHIERMAQKKIDDKILEEL